MALQYPKRMPSKATKGERKTISKVVKALSDDYSVYYEPKVSKVTPDILAIGANLGILVLEVKDYKISNLSKIEGDEWGFTDGTFSKSPYVQAKNYSFEVCNLLRVDPTLSDEKGRLKIRYGYGVVFSNITRLEFITNGLDDHFDLNLTIFKDDLDDLDDSDFFELLSGLLPYKNNEIITQEMQDRIRHHLFPEIRIGKPVKYDSTKLSKLNTLETMDRYQESISREVLDGHRLIRGVAGSGKTLILIARAKLLADNFPEDKILICCYGVTLRSYIKSVLGPKYKNIQVKTFHELIASSYQLYDDTNIETLNDMIENEIVYRVMFDHILVDEAQDMEPEWLGFLYQSIKGEEKSLLVCMDNAQNIFRRSLVSTTGIDFRGRSTVLNLNYRNPKVIMDFAWNYYNHYLDANNNPEVDSPLSSLNRRGSLKVDKFNSYDEEIARLVTRLYQQENYKDTAIIYRIGKFKIDYVGKLVKALDDAKIPYEWVTENRKSKSSYKHDTSAVKILTTESSKGLTFENVYAVAFSSMHPETLADVHKYVGLSYIIMTRSTKNLFITYHEDNGSTEGLEQNKMVSKSFTR